MSSRSEAFNSDNQARDNVTVGELAIDGDGKFLALRARQVQNLGAYVASAGIQLATNNFARCFPAMYDIPKLDIGVQCVYTNTLPTGPYRGAGRPEANYVIERLVEEAARDHRHRPVEIRKRNLIQSSAMPYKTAIGTTFDSGEFPEILDKALALAEIEGFRAAPAQLGRAEGKLRGLGISCFLEHSGGVPNEGAWLTFPGKDTLVVSLNVGNTGQGHATVYPRLVADKLGIDVAQVKHRQGDSDFEIKGWPSVASRSTITAGTAVVRTIEAMLEKGRKLAAHVLEADEKDIAYRRGLFEVVGTDRSIGLFELAAKAAEMKDKGEIEENLDTRARRRYAADLPQRLPYRRSRNRRRRPARSKSSPIMRSTIAASCSTTRWCTARCMAASRRGWDRCCWKTRSTIPAAASSSPARSWITPCRARITCRRCFATIPIRCRRPPIRSA